MPASSTVHATSSNHVTSRWLEIVDDTGSWAISGAGLWWCLGALLIGADRTPARGELEQALGLTKAEAADALAAMAAEIDRCDDLHLAAGMWLDPTVGLRPEYRAAIPTMTLAPMPAATTELDPWAREHTGGLIERFPEIDLSEVLMLLASAIAADGEWTIPFQEYDGMLTRGGFDVDDAAIVELDGRRISRMICRTTGSFDVHLVAGEPDDRSADVLSVAMAAETGRASIQPGSALTPGQAAGCLHVVIESAIDDRPLLTLTTPRFSIESDHDLCTRAEAFGLTAAMDRTIGHFPDISPTPMAVGEGRQSCAAVFGSKGFRAAAVTAVAMARAAGIPRDEVTRKVVRVDHDRPFGFLVVQRESGVVSFAGWVDHRREPTSERLTV